MQLKHSMTKNIADVVQLAYGLHFEDLGLSKNPKKNSFRSRSHALEEFKINFKSFVIRQRGRILFDRGSYAVFSDESRPNSYRKTVDMYHLDDCTVLVSGNHCNYDFMKGDELNIKIIAEKPKAQLLKEKIREHLPFSR